MALDRERAQENVGKVVDKLNELGDKTSQKASQFAQDKGLDKKAATAKEKTTGFIKDHKIDVAAETTAGVFGTGLRKLGEGLGFAGEGLGKAGASIEKSMKERKEARKEAEEKIFETDGAEDAEFTEAEASDDEA